MIGAKIIRTARRLLCVDAADKNGVPLLCVDAADKIYSVSKEKVKAISGNSHDVTLTFSEVKPNFVWKMSDI